MTGLGYDNAPPFEHPRPRRSIWRRLNAPQLFGGSFLLLILLGTLGLKVIPGLYTGEGLTWIDAVFTATSAVCVTGLIVVDTATYFTPFGQGFLLFLIQLGGLGMIAFTTVIIVAMGRKLSLRHESIATSPTEIAPEIDFRHLARHVIQFTAIFEITGAILLFIFWVGRLGVGEAAWAAIFHSISAFCNAGFSIFSDSLMGFQHSPATLGVIMVLIIVGGLGFITMEEIYVRANPREDLPFSRLSLHSRLVLVTTAVLLLSGAFVFTAVEWRITLSGMPTLDRVMNGLFMSVTARTAGFNTVDYAQTADASNFFTILLMSIGGSPGSTAGGFKTTTIAVIGLLAVARFRGLEATDFWHRSIPDEVIQRAIGLFVVAFGIVTVAILILATTELGRVSHGETSKEFLVHMFEAVSAFNTVGLSMGATGDLSVAGKWVVILLMYIGRIGPLTFAAAIALKSRPSDREFRYAYEEVVIG